jgi:hypothetical protein
MKWKIAGKIPTQNIELNSKSRPNGNMFLIILGGRGNPKRALYSLKSSIRVALPHFFEFGTLGTLSAMPAYAILKPLYLLG